MCSIVHSDARGQRSLFLLTHVSFLPQVYPRNLNHVNTLTEDNGHTRSKGERKRSAHTESERKQKTDIQTEQREFVYTHVCFIYIHLCMYMYAYIHTYIHTHTHTDTYTNTHIHTYIHTHTCFFFRRRKRVCDASRRLMGGIFTRCMLDLSTRSHCLPTLTYNNPRPLS